MQWEKRGAQRPMMGGGEGQAARNLLSLLCRVRSASWLHGRQHAVPSPLSAALTRTIRAWARQACMPDHGMRRRAGFNAAKATMFRGARDNNPVQLYIWPQHRYVRSRQGDSGPVPLAADQKTRQAVHDAQPAETRYVACAASIKPIDDGICVIAINGTQHMPSSFGKTGSAASSVMMCVALTWRRHCTCTRCGANRPATSTGRRPSRKLEKIWEAVAVPRSTACASNHRHQARAPLQEAS